VTPSPEGVFGRGAGARVVRGGKEK